MGNQKQKTIETYKQKSTVESFDKPRSRYAFQKYKHKIESDFLKRTIRRINQNKIKVLDVACGTGRMLSEIFSTRKEIEYCGLDTSKEMTKILKERAEKLDVEDKVKVKISDASKIPFKDNKFDVVYSYHLLWHLPKDEQKKIIKEMLRVCKKGGFVIFDILNKDFAWEKIKEAVGREKTKEIYKLLLSDVEEIIQNKDFKIEKLSDFPIKNNFVYNLSNIFNKIRKVLPLSLYHMLYIQIRK